MRFRSSNVCKSAGPEGVNTAGVIVGEPFFADVILSLEDTDEGNAQVVSGFHDRKLSLTQTRLLDANLHSSPYP
jgi:hypothetical protein